MEANEVRLFSMALALAAALLLTGCSGMISLNPFVTDGEASIDPALLGVWHDADGEDTCIIKQAGMHYAITYVDKSSSAITFEAWLLASGDAKFLDLVPGDDSPFRIAAHTPVRVWTEGTTLRFSFLDSDWLRQQATQQLATQLAEDRTLITAPGESVRHFLMEYGADARAYGEVQTLERAQ